MPPKVKPAAGKPSKKTEEKKKDKVIEDKTFGIKNKKGNKQQRFIKVVTNQVKFGNQGAKKAEALKDEKNKVKDDKKKTQEEMNALFKPIQTVQKGVDPKSVVCAFYKQGQCKKGDKCKFSHDLSMDRKAPKKSIYEDTDKADSMESWNEETLTDIVNKKHGEKNKGLPLTVIICKYFLEAVEKNRYGWFWNCPNGDSCHYRHALPQGYVLKRDVKKEDKSEQISIEELIEKERSALGSNTTKITLESFLKWKDRKRKEKVDNLKKTKEKKKSDFKMGKCLGISGREMFEFNPELIVDDDEEADEGAIERETIEDEDESESPCEVKEIDIEEFSRLATDNDSSGTQRGKHIRATNEEANKLDEAAALPNGSVDVTGIGTENAINAAMAATVNGDLLAGDVPIDENLFEGEDLDALEDDLDTLELDD